jgi:hypothetical protein
MQVVAYDLDADGRDEIALGYVQDDLMRVRVLDDVAHGLIELQSPILVGFSTGGAIFEQLGAGRLIAADLDGDGGEELVTGWADASDQFFMSGDLRLELTAWDWNGGLVVVGSRALEGRRPNHFGAEFPPAEAWDLGARYVASEGRDRVAVVLCDDYDAERYDIYELFGNALQVDLGRTYGLPFQVSGKHRPAIATGDVDASGEEVAYACFLLDQGLSVTPRLHRLGADPDAGNHQDLPAMTLTADGGRPLLALADVDGDGYVVRSTGVRRQQLADPIPLVVMTAVPTKAGAAQNLSNSSTSYAVATGDGTSIGVSTTATVSAGAGFGGSIGWFGAQATTEIERSFQTSEVTTTSTTTITGYNSGPDDDVIIFQGTLYESFEYEVLSGPDPDKVGAYFTLDLPATAKTYKWTVSKYDETFQELALSSDVLPHTIGDPASYRSRAETEALLATYVGWTDGSAKTVGEGTGSNSTQVDLAEEQATTEERSWSITDSLEFSVGWASGTLSSGLSNSEMVTVTTVETTSYAGEVGDLAGDDWDRWHYDFGMAVYTDGLPAGGGAPTKVPVQVIAFWTEPNGSGYP